MTNGSSSSRPVISANFEPSAHIPTTDSQGLRSVTFVGMLRLTSLFPSSSLGDTFDGELKQPRKAHQRPPALPETKEESRLDVNHDSGSISASEIPIEEAISSLSKDVDRTVASPNQQIDYQQLADRAKTEEIIALRKDLDRLRRDLTTAADEALNDRQRHEAESTKFISQIEECRLSEAAKAEELVATHRQLQQLQRDLSTSSSLATKLQQYNEMLSTERASIHEQLQTVSSNGDDKDRMIASLSDEIEEWKQLDVTRTEELDAACRNVNQLRLDIALEQRHAVESVKELSGAQEKTQRLAKKISSLRHRYQIALSSIEEKDDMIATQIAQIEQLKLRDAAQAEELIATRNDLGQLRCDSITNQERHAAESAELAAQVEESKRSNAAKVDKLSAAHRDLEQLRSNLAASATQIADVQQRHATKSTELASKVEELKRLNTIQAQDLATAHEKITNMESHRIASSSRIIELE
ncbi:hypothetical protein JVU11DRAFT_1208 [Chiua virens]|nr:hypothetical protein JVU11DRAFT_1208 [Chiua virens]